MGRGERARDSDVAEEKWEVGIERWINTAVDTTGSFSDQLSNTSSFRCAYHVYIYIRVTVFFIPCIICAYIYFQFMVSHSHVILATAQCNVPRSVY